MARRSSLVCQYLENASWQLLEQHQQIIRRYAHKRHGVYALYNKTKLYYVGLAINLSGRLNQHLRDRHKGHWDRFSIYFTLDNSHIKELESLLLRIVKPTGNRQSGKFGRAENLRKRFKNDIQLHYRAELASFLGLKFVLPVRTEERVDPKSIVRYLNGRQLRVKGIYNGKTHRALILRDGTVRFRKEIYSSLSLAAATARGTKKCDGWWFWTYERAPGDWIRLRELRG
jgi:hypothetical protein